MLFNSAIFLFVFLPLTMLGFGLAFRRLGLEAAWTWLAAASLFFYGWWSPAQVPLLLGSIVLNYWIGTRLQRSDTRPRSQLLLAGVVINLGLLGYYKYWPFFVTTAPRSPVGAGMRSGWSSPPGISFYTFHRFAYSFWAQPQRDGGHAVQSLSDLHDFLSRPDSRAYGASA